MTERLQLHTSDGVTLETKIDSPETPRVTTVFCHPHPLYGGSMNAPLMIAVTRTLVERGHQVLRFNFRGTGSSTGSHDYGKAEMNDISAAYDHASGLGLPVTLTGWSFGAATSLNWLAANSLEIPYAGIAPPAGGLPESLPAGPKRVILGSRDQVVDRAELQTYCEIQGVDLVVTQGDHFFHGRGDRIGVLVAQGLDN